MLGQATASWVFTSTLGSLQCLFKRHYMEVVGFEPWTSRSRFRRSITEPPRLPRLWIVSLKMNDGRKHKDGNTIGSLSEPESRIQDDKQTLTYKNAPERP